MLRDSEALLSLTNVVTSPSATERFLRAAASSSLSPLSIVDTSDSDSLKARTVESFWARVQMNSSSCAAEPNSSSLLSSRVCESWLKSEIVWLNCSPWPPKLSAVTSRRSVRAPFLLAPSGPSATLRSLRLE